MTTKATRPKSVLTTEEAAEYLGIPVDELMRSRYRGLAPGSLGFKKGGVLVWKRSNLKKPVGVTDD